MPNENLTQTNEGWKPKPAEPLNKGYQPVHQTTIPGHVPIDGGYQPTSQGDNPGNGSTPPGPE